MIITHKGRYADDLSVVSQSKCQGSDKASVGVAGWHLGLSNSIQQHCDRCSRVKTTSRKGPTASKNRKKAEPRKEKINEIGRYIVGYVIAANYGWPPMSLLL